MVPKMMKAKMEKLDIPPVSEFVEIMAASGVKMWACKLAIEMFELKEEDLIDDFTPEEQLIIKSENSHSLKYIK